MILSHIEDSNDPRIALFRERRDAQLVDEGLVLVDGAKNVERLLQIGVRIKSVLGRESYFATQSFGPETACYCVSAPVMHEIIGYKYHQGVIALAERPALRSTRDLGDRVVAFENLVDAENVGAIVRCAHGLGATGIIAGGTSCSPFVRRAVRVSMASVFSLAVRETHDLVGDLYHLADLGYRLIGADVRGDDLTKRVEPEQKTVLILGNEDQGLTHDTLSVLDQRLRIPMVSSIDSLNVSHAAAILCWELFGRHS